MLETQRLAEDGELRGAALNILLSVLAGVAAALSAARSESTRERRGAEAHELLRRARPHAARLLADEMLACSARWRSRPACCCEGRRASASHTSFAAIACCRSRRICRWCRSRSTLPSGSRRRSSGSSRSGAGACHARAGAPHQRRDRSWGAAGEPRRGHQAERLCRRQERSGACRPRGHLRAPARAASPAPACSRASTDPPRRARAGSLLRGQRGGAGRGRRGRAERGDRRGPGRAALRAHAAADDARASARLQARRELLARPHELPGSDEAGRPLWQKLTVHCSQAATHSGRSLNLEIIAACARPTLRAPRACADLGLPRRPRPHGDRLLSFVATCRS